MDEARDILDSLYGAMQERGLFSSALADYWTDVFDQLDSALDPRDPEIEG